MSWTNPPPAVVAFRDALIATTTVSNTIFSGLTLLQTQARFHYPRADFRTDTMPAFVLQRMRQRAVRGDATGTLGSGTVVAMLCVSDSSVDDGTVEQYVDAICNDLCSLSTADTLYVISAEAGDCIEPSAGMIAAAVSGQQGETSVTFRTASITAEWEG